MLFNSYTFLLFFLPPTLFLYYCARCAVGSRRALTVVFAASLLFYASWNPPYLLLLLASIAGNYLVSGRLEASTRARRAWLVAGIALNLLLLGYFKYTHFILGVIAPAARLDSILLPLGISFYTFQQIMFLTDIYRAGGKLGYGLGYYAASVAFFPHLIAGPIVPYRELMPQFAASEQRDIPWAQIAPGILLFTIGMIKKVMLADPLAEPVARVFDSAALGKAVSLSDAWGGALAYTFQLYFDFSGYTDMALGLGHLFGIRLPANFLSPYKSRSIGEFWRRWHITLSNFLRDHLYIPLGGNRGSDAMTARNLMLTMGLGGLWHGAGWTFIVWGVMHGAYLVVNRFWGRRGYRLPCAVAWSATFLAVVIGWVMFRADSIPTALRLYQAMCAASWGVDALVSHADQARIALVASIAFLAPNSIELVRGAADKPARIEPRIGYAILAAVALFGCMLSLGKPSEFLYFNF